MPARLAAVLRARRITLVNLGLLLLLGLVLAYFWGDYALRQVRWWLTGTVRVDGLVLHLNPEDEYITSVMVEWGVWEPLETAVLQRELGPGDTFIDVGAYIGYYTVIASREVGESGRVIAFEPDPTNFALLERNVHANGCTNVILEQKALSDTQGVLRLFLHDSSKGSHSFYESEETRGSIEVEAVPLDAYLRDLSGHVQLIKIDTEGAEGIIFEGMKETLQSRKDIRLLMEFYPWKLQRSGYAPDRLLDGLESLGFRIQEIHEGRGEVFPATAEALLERLPADRRVWTNIFLERPTPPAAPRR